MAMTWMGIDGGGTSLRVIVIDNDLHEIAYVEGESANPSSLGHDVAQQHIRTMIGKALKQANLTTVDAVGIGIAGASDEYASPWLYETVQGVLPNTQIVPSSDVEIALVGARGQRDGILLLSGTGSIAIGIAPDGRRLRVGGWGYILGDEGSGYWLGLEALKLLTRWADGFLKDKSPLFEVLMQHLQLKQPIELIEWRYHHASVHDVAALAPLVLAAAGDGDIAANTIIEEGAQWLAKTGELLCERLDMSTETIAFAGSLMVNDTLLSQRVQQKLKLKHNPLPKYRPVVGAALLAKMEYS